MTNTVEVNEYEIVRDNLTFKADATVSVEFDVFRNYGYYAGTFDYEVTDYYVEDYTCYNDESGEFGMELTESELNDIALYASEHFEPTVD